MYIKSFFLLLVPFVFIVAIVRHVVQNKVMYTKQAKKCGKKSKQKIKCSQKSEGPEAA